MRNVGEPHTISEYRGRLVSLYFFVLLTAVTLVRSLIHIIAPDGGAQSVATIPLDAFTDNGVAVVVHLFALWGLSQLVVGVLYLVALLRFRGLIPLLYGLAIVEYGVRLLLTFLKPIETTGTAPGAVGNYVLLPLLAVMLWLSLSRRRNLSARPADGDCAEPAV